MIEYLTLKLWDVDENECDFSSITLHKNDLIVLTIVPEDYRSGGGPFPYHDSVTYTVFYTDILIEEINARFRRLCESKQYSLSDIIYGLDKPHISITEKIKNLFR